MKAANKPRNFVRFQYKLSPNSTLEIQTHEDQKTTIGPYDFGFSITTNGIKQHAIALRKLPEFQNENSDFANAYLTLAVTRACKGNDTIYFVTMKYQGDKLSPALVFVLLPSKDDYVVLTLPEFSGGTVDVSRVDPLHLKIWNNLNEGMCNACETAYRITEYEIQDGKLSKMRSHRTRRLYTSGDFDDWRVRFVP